MLHVCNYFYGTLVCSVVYYSMLLWSHCCFWVRLNLYTFFIATVPLLSCNFLYSITLQQQYKLFCDLNHSREIVNWVRNYLIPSIIGEKYYSSI